MADPDIEKIARAEIQYLEVAGRLIPAYKLVCPECRCLDLGTEVHLNAENMTAYCTQSHRWEINPESEA